MELASVLYYGVSYLRPAEYIYRWFALALTGDESSRSLEANLSTWYT